MRRRVRAIIGAFEERVSAEDLRRYYRDQSRRFWPRLVFVLGGALAYGLLFEGWGALAILLFGAGAEILEEQLARRVLRRPIEAADLASLHRRSVAQAALYGGVVCLALVLLWSQGDDAASLLAIVLALGATFDASFLLAVNRLATLAKVGLYALAVAGHFAAEAAWAEPSRALAIELCAVAVLAYFVWLFARDVRGARRHQARTNTALAERGAALERALAELTEKEAAMRRLALAMEHVGDSVVITDPGGRIDWVNGAFTARTGWTLDEVAGRPRRSLADPDNDPAVFAAIEAALADRRSVRVPIRLWNRGGRSVWHEAILTPLLDAEGRPTHWISVERDVSERKAREAALARSQAEAARLALVAEHARDAVVIYGPDGRIEWVNPAFTAQTGYAPHEALGRVAGGLVVTEADEATPLRVRAAMAAERAVRAELQLRRKDGGVFWCEANLSPVHGPDGRLRHYVSVERDVSELKAREAELAEKERELRRLALVAQHANDCMFLAAVDGRIEWVNHAFVEQTGLAPEEVVGRSAGSLVAPDADRDAMRALGAAVEAGLPARAELKLDRRGRSVWHDVSLTPVRDEEGRLRHYITVERDISELKAREAELAEKERELRRLALVAQHATDAILLAGPDGRVEWVNASFCATIGWSLAEVAGRHLKSFLAPDAPEAVLGGLRHAAREGRTYRAEAPIGRRDGAAWHDVIATPIRDEAGAIVHWVAVLRDISELKAREAELAAKDTENRRLALVARHAGDAIALTDASGTIEWVNDAFLAAAEAGSGDILGRHLSIFDAPDCDPDALAQLKAATRAGRPCRTQLQLLRAGRSVWHDIRQTPILDESGAHRHWISVERDITELKAREAELAAKDAENRRLALVARHANDCMLITGPDRRIEWVNQAFLDHLGYTPEEAIGLHAAALDAPDNDEETLRALARAVSSGRPFRSELKVRRRDGSTVWHDVRVTPLLGEDGVQRYVTVERDIDEAKAREAELGLARRAAEEAAEARARFLATMSHEIRTPMNGIIGTADLLGDTPLDDDQRRLLGTIAQSSEGLLRIINDVLDLSKLEAGAVEIAPEPFEPAALAEICVQLMRPLALRKGLALSLELEGAAREPLMGDPDRLRQVLLNLLGNAIKFTEGGGVTLRASVAPSEERRRLVLAVADTGIGIAPDRLEGVFDAFAQADGSITRRFGGTGLGLSISRQIAQAMGGALTAASAPGEGSTFTLALDLPPAAAASAAEPPPPAGRPPGPPAGEGASAPLALVPAAPGEARDAALVLLVEDNATNRFLVQRMLEDQGLRIAMAEDGAEGVAAFERLAPDLVITDISMPVLDGFEATRRIRAIEAGPAWRRPPCPVLAFSANVGAADRERGAEVGVTRFLAKPIRKAELRAAVLAELNRGGEGGSAPPPAVPPSAAPPRADGPAAARGLG